MAAGTYNIIIEKGATFSRVVTIKDSDEIVVDITNVVEIRASLRTREQATDSWDFTCTKSATPTDGKFTWSMTATNTALLPSGNGVYDLELEWPNGSVERILSGDIQIKGNITR